MDRCGYSNERTGDGDETHRYMEDGRNCDNEYDTAEIREKPNEREKILEKINNVVIPRLEELGEKKVVEINRAIGNNNFSHHNIIKIGRIGERSETKSRPLKVELDCRVSKINMMRNAKNLQSLHHYYNVSIQHDLTKKQSYQLQQIKEEARYQERCNEEGTFRYSVRGPPGRWTIVKLPKNY